VPTTRALCLVGTGDRVERDMFYDGRAKLEPGAIVCRAAPSFVRFGNFELPSSRGDLALLEKLLDFTIARDFPEIEDGDDVERRARLFGEVCERTALLMVHWMRVGFVHGVMNTDNMSVLGLTIDYGPYGWIDDFDPTWTPNTTDAHGRRYRFGAQPDVAHWNLGRFARALAPIFPSTDLLEAGLRRYVETFDSHAAKMLASKLGFERRTDDEDLVVSQAFERMAEAGVDMTLFFRGLAEVDIRAPSLGPLDDAFYDDDRRREHGGSLLAWLGRWAERQGPFEVPDPDRRRARMKAVNPRFVLRNYLAQEAIDLAENGDFTRIHTLLEASRRPYDDEPTSARFVGKRPDWAKERAGCSMLSCSS
jgi:uncharacterized protein YdiU (UPF0061 family)